MTRLLNFKLAYIVTAQIFFLLFGLSVFVTIISGEYWALLVFPCLLLIWVVLPVCMLRRDLLVLPYLRDIEAVSPLFAWAGSYYSLAYALFQIGAIFAFAAMSPLFIEIPVSFALSAVGQYELAERIHRLDGSYEINRCPVAIILNGAKLKGLKHDSSKQEKAILTVYGNDSTQLGFWYLGKVDEEALANVSERRKLLTQARDCFKRAGKKVYCLQLCLRLAELEAEQKNIQASNTILNENKIELETIFQDPSFSLENQVSILSSLSDVYTKLGKSDKSKSLSKIKEVKETELEKSYLFGLGHLPFTERIATGKVLLLSVIMLPFSIFYGIVGETLFWRNKRILRKSRDPKKLMDALHILIPIALYKRKRDLADDYSRRLLDLAEKSA